MERLDNCPDEDIICIAEVLAERSEAPREDLRPAPDFEERDCLPCLLADLDLEEQD